MGPSQLELLFNPGSIAVFGASDSGVSVGSRVFSNLLAGGFAGPVIPINPKHRQVGGKTCYPTIDEVEEDIDLAIIATPARTVPEIFHQCGEADIHNAIVLSAGFSEAGKQGKQLEAATLDAARHGDIRFIGPQQRRARQAMAVDGREFPQFNHAKRPAGANIAVGRALLGDFGLGGTESSGLFSSGLAR